MKVHQTVSMCLKNDQVKTELIRKLKINLNFNSLKLKRILCETIDCVITVNNKSQQNGRDPRDDAFTVAIDTSLKTNKCVSRYTVNYLL